MVDRIKDWAIFLRDFLQDKMGWFLFGLGLGGASWYFANHRATAAEEKALLYEERYFDCQKNSTSIELNAQKGCIENAQKQIEAIMQVSDVLKGQSETQKEYIEQRKKRMQENKKFIKEIEQVANENS